jgi:hypothetical protein
MVNEVLVTVDGGKTTTSVWVIVEAMHDPETQLEVITVVE